MVYEFALSNDAANQSFYMKNNGHTIYFRLATFRGMTYADIQFDGELVVSGRRVTQFTSLLPQRYDKLVSGVFYFTTVDDEYPSYINFDGVKTSLIFEGEIGNER